MKQCESTAMPAARQQPRPPRITQRYLVATIRRCLSPATVLVAERAFKFGGYAPNAGYPKWIINPDSLRIASSVPIPSDAAIKCELNDSIKDQRSSRCGVGWVAWVEQIDTNKCPPQQS